MLILVRKVGCYLPIPLENWLLNERSLSTITTTQPDLKETSNFALRLNALPFA